MTSTTHTTATPPTTVTVPYPVLPLTSSEPSAITSPDPEDGVDYIGCGICVDWDVSYLSADGHLYNSTRHAPPEANDMLTGYTACNQCGRIYPNAHRYSGPLPTLARIDVTADVWLDALDQYNSQTFGAPLTRPANTTGSA